MASEVGICNLALSHIGISKEIANLDNEKSVEAAACRRFFTTVRDQVLRDFAWPFATRIVTLAKVEDQPDIEWAASYRYPSDTVVGRRLLSGIRNDNRQSRVPMRISRDAEGLLILTDEIDPEFEYTFREEDTERFPADFTMAFSFRLAWYLAPRLTRGDDPGRLGARAIQSYLFEISRAEAAAGNEEQPDDLPESEFIRAREGFSPRQLGQNFLDFFGISP